MQNKYSEDRYGISLTSQRARRALGAYLKGDRLTVEHLSHLACGSHLRVPVLNPNTGELSGPVPYRDLDLAATKPILLPVAEMADHIERTWRQNYGRGSGAKSDYMTDAMDQARVQIGRFFGYDPEEHVVIFTPNTSHGMNKIVRIAARDPNTRFLLSLISHHTAQLPARIPGRYAFFALNPDGTYDLNDLENQLKGSTELHRTFLFIESESNVTGYKPPIQEICRLAQKYSALVVIDHAQGASNLKLNLKNITGKVFMVISGHKVYARDGSGAIIGPRDFFMGDADEPAGGTIKAVTKNSIAYKLPPENQEAGTQAFISQISLAKALSLLDEAGMEEIEQRERETTRRFLLALSRIDGLEIAGEPDILKVDRGPVISFAIKQPNSKFYIHPLIIAKALSTFWGIGTRIGFFCAHPYGYFLRNVHPNIQDMHFGVHSVFSEDNCVSLPIDNDYHMVRFSFSFVTDPDHLEDIPEILRELIANRSSSDPHFHVHLETGEIFFDSKKVSLSSA